MDSVSQRVLDHLTEIEEAAEDVLSTKQQMSQSSMGRGGPVKPLNLVIVDLDIKKNSNREALNALKHELSGSEKVTVCFGNMFIRFPKLKTREMIQKDQEQLEREINDLRKGLKAKINRLNEMQGKPELRGYSLSPLSADEISAINSLLKR